MANLVTNIRWSDNTQAVARNITAGLDVIGRSVGEVRQQVREAAKTVSELEKALSDIKPSGKALVDLTAEIDRAKGAHAALKQELAALDPKAKGAAASLKSVGTEAAGAGKGLKDAGDAAKTAGDQVEKARANFQQIGAAMTTVGRGMSIAITAPIVGAAAASVKFASDFEADMVKVHTLSGVTESDMQAMRTQILALGPAVGMGPDELAKAMLAVTSTGITGAKAMDILTIAAKASAVGMGDAATIARTITSIIKAYGEENMTAAHASEIMFKIVKDGNADAQELAGSLGRVVGIASTLGVKFEDVGTFIATFTRIGVNTNEAVTALRGFIGALELKKPSKDAIAALDSVGLTFDKLRANIKDMGLTAAALDLFGRFKGHEADLQPVIANIRAMAGAMGTYGAQAKDVIEIQKHMVAQTSELEDAFGRTKETSAFKFKELTAELQALAITVGAELLPHLNSLIKDTLIPGVKTVEGWVEQWKKLPQPIKTFSEVLIGMGAAGGPVLLALGTLARSIGAIQILLFGANVPAATSIAAVLAKLGLGGGAAAAAEGGAAATAGAGAAATGGGAVVGAGEMAALWSRIRPGLTAGQGLSAGQSIAMGGAMILAAKQANAAFDKVDQELLEQRQKAFDATLPHVTKSTDALFPGGKPPEIGATGIIAGTRIEDVVASTSAHKALSERVKELTAANREEILAEYEKTGSIKAAAAAAGVATDVVSAFIHQQKEGAKGSTEYAKAWAELNSVGETYRDTLAGIKPELIGEVEYYLKAGRSVATLAEAYKNDLTKAQIEAIEVQLRLKLATVPLTDAQNQVALSLLRVNAAAGETIYSIDQIARAAGAAPVQIKLLKATLDELAKVEKSVKLTGPIAGLTLVNPKQEIAAYRADLDKLTQAQHAAEDAQLSGVAAAVRAIERKRDADIKAIKEELGADEELKHRRIQLATDTATAQIALANGTSKDIVAITHALGLQTQSELQATVAKYKAEYETLKNAVTKDWEAIDAARKRYEEALAKSNAGEAFKQALEKSLKGIPDLLIKAFLGGGGLKGAVSALGVELGQVFAEGIARGVKQSKAGTPLPEGSEGPVKPGSGVNSTVLIGAGGVGGLAGAGAEASGATGKQAAGTVGLTAASIGAQVGIQAGSWTAGIAAGAATAGIGLAVVAAIEIYKAKHKAQWEKLGIDIGSAFGVNLSKETLKAWEQESKVFGRQATGLLHLDEIIAAAGGIAKFGFDKAAAGAHDLFSMVQTGQLSIAQAKQELDKLWPALAKGGTDAYGRISDKLKELIKLNQQYKTDSAEIAAFQKQQGGNAIAGVNATVETLGLSDIDGTTFEAIGKRVADAKKAVDDLAKAGKSGTSEWRTAVDELAAAQKRQGEYAEANKQTLDDLGTQALGAYAAAVAAGASEAEALAAIAPSLKTLRDSYKSLGLDVEDVGVKALLMQDTILNGTDKLGAGINGLNQEFVALDNLGLMNEETFNSLERTGAKMFERLKAKAIENGGTQKDALVPMQQYLHEAEDAAKKYGYKLDDATQAMIDLSKAEGVWKDADPADTVEGGIKDLIGAVKDLINTLRGIPPKIDTEVTVTTKFRKGDDGSGDKGDGGKPLSTGGRVTATGMIQRFATGGMVLPFQAPRHFADGGSVPQGEDTIPAMVSPGELIANKAQQATIGRMLSAGVAMAASLALATATWKIPDLPRGRDLIPETLSADRATEQQSRTSDFLRTGTVTPMSLVAGPDGRTAAPQPIVAIDMKPTIYLTSDDTKDPDRVLDILKVGLRDDRSLIRTAVEKVALKAVENAS